MLTFGGIGHEVAMQTAAVATGDGIPFPCAHPDVGALSTLTMQVVGITTATITFEGTIDGSTWAAVQVVPLATGTAATTATANGLFRLDIRGISFVRARISAWTSGSITVTGAGVAG